MTRNDIRPRWAYAALVVLLTGAAWMRLTDLQDTSFLLDSAWVLIWVDNIVHQHQFPLLGARMTPGGFLGPAMTYLMVPVGLVSAAPEAFAAFVGLTNLLSVVLVFHIGRRYFGARAGLLGALLLGYNLFAVSASRGVWNPFLVPLFSALLTLLLLRFFVDGAAKALIGIALCLSFLLQLHLHTAVLAVYCLLLALLLPRPSVSRSTAVAAALVIVVTLILPLLVFDLRNDFYNAKRIIGGWSTLQASALPMAARAEAFFSMNVFTDRLFRWLFLIGVGLTAVDLARHWRNPTRSAGRLILLLPAALLFFFVVVVGRFPLVPRFMQSLMVPAAVLCGVTADEVARRASGWLGTRHGLVNAALCVGGLLYMAVVANAYQARGRYYGLGHLATIRQVVRLVIEDSQSRGASRSSVFVCEDGSGDIAEYGRSYGYMLKHMGAEPTRPKGRAAGVYMLSDFVQSDTNRIGSFEGVGVYWYPDLARFASFLHDFPDAVCHRAVVENFPFRTG